MRIIDRIVCVPVVMQRQVPTIQTVQKTVEVRQVQFLDSVAELLVVMQRKVRMSSMRCDSSRPKPTTRVLGREVCRRTARLSDRVSTTHSRPRRHLTTQARALRVTPPPCLGGASHGCVPVETHSTPVLPTVGRLWVALPQNDICSFALLCGDVAVC